MSLEESIQAVKDKLVKVRLRWTEQVISLCLWSLIDYICDMRLS